MDNYTNLDKFIYDTCPGSESEDFVNDLFIEKHNILKEMPLELQFDYNNFIESYHNVYNYYLDKENIKDLPDIFYNDYIFCVVDKAFKMQNHKDLIKELKEFFSNK